MLSVVKIRSNKTILLKSCHKNNNDTCAITVMRAEKSCCILHNNSDVKKVKNVAVDFNL